MKDNRKVDEIIADDERAQIGLTKKYETGNLDPDLSVQILSLLEKINRAGTTVIMATHDSSIVNRRKKRIIELKDGKIIRDESNGSYVVR